MSKDNSNTKKSMDASYNSLPSTTHQIAPKHFVQQWIFTFKGKTYKSWKKDNKYDGKDRISKDVASNKVQYGGNKFP